MRGPFFLVRPDPLVSLPPQTWTFC